MATIFTRIVNGEIPCHKVAEDENYLAMLDINPLRKGHTLVLPKKEVDYIFDIDDDTLAGLTVFASRVAKGIKKVIPCKRVAVVVLGLEVPHAHIHLIPLDKESDIEFSKERVQLNQDELIEISEKIASEIEM